MTAPTRPTQTCPLDGSTLHTNGFCPTGNGFPITTPHCPDVCPACRRHLRWDGDCDACRPPDYKPGHCYTYEPYSRTNASSAHWHIAIRGPQPIATPSPDLRASLPAHADLHP
jgi:hypothetical protein